MGHYYAEMACSKCGRPNCVCQNHAPTKLVWVLNTSDWSITERYETGFDLLYGRSTFKKREEAEEAIPRLIRERKEELLAEIEMLDAMLNLVPGKTNICPECFEEFHSCFCHGGYR